MCCSINIQQLSTICHNVRVCSHPAMPNMFFKEQELSLQNVLSLSPVHLCGTLCLQISVSDLRLTLLFLKCKLKVAWFVLLLFGNFLPFLNVTIVICYCTLFHTVIRMALMQCNVIKYLMPILHILCSLFWTSSLILTAS